MNFPKTSEVCSHIDGEKFDCSRCMIYFKSDTIYLYLDPLSPLFWTNYICLDSKNVCDRNGCKIFSLEDCKDYKDLLNKIKKFEVFK